MSNRLVLQQVVEQSMEHVVEPVADQVLRYVIGRLGYTSLMKDHIYLVSDFRKTSLTTDADNNPVMSVDRVIARLTPNVNPSSAKWEGNKTVLDLGNGNTLVRTDAKSKRPWTGKHFSSNSFTVFHDPVTYVDLTEWNVGSALQLEVKMEFKSASMANECLSRIFAAYINGEMIDYAKLHYNYPIPPEIRKVMEKIYSMTDHPKTDEAYNAWLREKSDECLSWNVNREDLRVKELVARRNLGQAMFMLECSQEAPEQGEHTSTVTFNLTVQYSRTNRLILDYPLIINNQNLPFEFCSVPHEWRAENRGPFRWQNIAVDKYWQMNYHPSVPKVTNVPWWDNWEVPTNSIVRQRGFLPLYIVPILIDHPEDPNSRVELDIVNDLPGYKLCDAFIEMLKEEGRKATGYRNVYINLSVYVHDEILDRSDLEFDGQILKVNAHDKSQIYRLVISVNPTPPELQPFPKNLVWIATIIPKRMQ